MRPLVVLALAPILALGLALSAGSIVPDKAAPIKQKPESLVWSGRVFTERTQFAHWLAERDASYGLWVRRHPSASWFHKQRVLAPPPPAKARAASAAPKHKPKTRQDLGRVFLYLVLGFGLMLAAGGIIRGIPQAVRSAQSTRRRRVAWDTPGANGVALRRPVAEAVYSASAPHPPPRPSRRGEPAPVYASPRAYPTRAGSDTPARLVPLYVPPEPEELPVAVPAAVRGEPAPVYHLPERSPEPRHIAPVPAPPAPPEPPVLVPVPAPEPEPVVALPEPEPEAALPAPEPEPPVAPEPEPVVALPEPEPEAALPAPQPEPEPAVAPEPEPEPVPAAEVAIEPAPAVEPEPVVVAPEPVVVEPEPAVEEPEPVVAVPEPVVVTPEPAVEAEPLPEIQAPAAKAAPAAEAEPVSEPEPAPPARAARPLQTTVLPGPAPEDEEWDTCEIAVWQGYFKSQFYARVLSPEGDEYALALSPLFRSKSLAARDEVARAAHLQLAQTLLSDGWVSDGRGPYWWALRFRPAEPAS